MHPGVSEREAAAGWVYHTRTIASIGYWRTATACEKWEFGLFSVGKWDKWKHANGFAASVRIRRGERFLLFNLLIFFNYGTQN